MPKLNDKEVVELAEELKNRDRGRDTVIKTLYEVYWENKFTDTLNTLLSSERRRSSTARLLVNLIKPRVRDKVNLLTILPDISVEPPYNAHEDGIFWKEFLELVLYGHWSFNNMGHLVPNIGHFLSLAGFSPVMVFPDFAAKRPRIYLREPTQCHAELKMSSNVEYLHVLFTWKEKGRQILGDYPTASGFVSNTNEEFDIIEYWTDEERRLLVGNDRIKWNQIPGTGVEHELGFIPVRVIPNVPGRLDGLSDISHEIGLVENLNELLILSTEERRERLGGILMVKDGRNVPKEIPTGRGTLIEVKGEGDLKYVTKVDTVTDVLNDVGVHERLFREATNWPGARQGQPIGSVVTGKGITAAQSIVADDTQASKESIGQDLVKLNEYIIAMEKKMFGKNKQKAWGRKGTGGNWFPGFEYNPKEDFPDTFRHELIFFPLGHDIPTMIVNLLQLHGQGVLSLRSVLDRIPGINTAEELRRLEEDIQRKVKWQTIIAGLSQQMAGQGEEVAPEAVEQAAYGMERGAMPSPPMAMAR